MTNTKKSRFELKCVLEFIDQCMDNLMSVLTAQRCEGGTGFSRHEAIKPLSLMILLRVCAGWQFVATSFWKSVEGCGCGRVGGWMGVGTWDEGRDGMVGGRCAWKGVSVVGHGDWWSWGARGLGVCARYKVREEGGRGC